MNLSTERDKLIDTTSVTMQRNNSRYWIACLRQQILIDEHAAAHQSPPIPIIDETMIVQVASHAIKTGFAFESC
jgi:hypothetical protein